MLHLCRGGQRWSSQEPQRAGYDRRYFVSLLHQRHTCPVFDALS